MPQWPSDWEKKLSIKNILVLTDLAFDKENDNDNSRSALNYYNNHKSDVFKLITDNIVSGAFELWLVSKEFIITKHSLEDILGI